MGTGLWLGLLIAASPLKIASTAWEFSGIEAQQGNVFQERFITLLAERAGVSIITQKDIGQVLGFERQKELLGCNEGASDCMGELANALGADALLSGSLAKTEKFYVVTVRGVNTANGRTFATASARFDSEAELFTWLEREAGAFADRMKESFDVWVESRNVRHFNYQYWLLGTMAVGVAAAATGAGLFGSSRTDLNALHNAAVSDEPRLIAQGQLKQDLGIGLIIGGGVVAVASLVLFFVTRSEDVAVSFAPTERGGLFAFTGRWP